MGQDLNKEFKRQLRNQFSMKELDEKEQDAVFEFLNQNFELDLEMPTNPEIVQWIKQTLMQMLKYQKADLANQPDQLFTFDMDRGIITLTTHLHMAIKTYPILTLVENSSMNANIEDEEYAVTINRLEHFNKIFTQGNPFILRCHVFALTRRLDEILGLKGEATEGDEDEVVLEPSEEALDQEKLNRINVTMKSLEDAEKNIDKWVEKAPGYAYFLKTVIEFNLAKHGSEENKKQHMKEAYKHFLTYDKLKHHSPKMEYVLSIGKGHLADLPEDTLIVMQRKMESALTAEERREISATQKSTI